MPAAEQLTIHRALTQFCEQRARIEVLGRQITENVGKITGLHLQSSLMREQWGPNVVCLDAARSHHDLAKLFSDTARLAKLAHQLHADFSAAAKQYLHESECRRATLKLGRENLIVSSCDVLRSRIDSAIDRCDKEIIQIECLIERSGASVTLLLRSTQQVLGLAM